jgi:chitosanase
MLTATQRTCLEIVEIFEGGRPDNYGALVAIPGDTGGLSGGLLQATMNSGNLGKLLRLYRTYGGTTITEDEVLQVERKDPSQNNDPIFRKMFKAAASEQPMRDAQDTYFYGMFLAPAERTCQDRGWTEPLVIALVLDGFVHGSFKKINSMVPSTLNQWEWARTYIQLRKRWLAEHANPVLNKCIYRMETFEALVAANNWQLSKPFLVHGYNLT